MQAPDATYRLDYEWPSLGVVSDEFNKEWLNLVAEINAANAKSKDEKKNYVRILDGDPDA